MADFVFNVAKGRVAELVSRVKSNDPVSSALVVVALKSSGLETDAVLKDYADLGALLAAANDEATNAGYARKVLDDTAVGATPVVVDNTNDWVDVTIPNQTWSAVQAAGGNWGAILLCYDADTTAGTDSNVVPLLKWDAAITAEGTDIGFTVTAPGVYRAS